MPGKSRAQLQREQAEAEEGFAAQSQWHPAFPRRAHDYALLGADNAEIARLLGVSQNSVDAWMVEKPAFRRAINSARVDADVRVVKSLHRRALGYTLNDVQVKKDKDGQVIETVEKKRHVPASDAAINLWLTNRRPQQWRDRGAASGDVQVNLLAIVEASLGKPEPKVIEAATVSADGDGQAPDTAAK